MQNAQMTQEEREIQEIVDILLANKWGVERYDEIPDEDWLMEQEGLR